MEKRNYVKPNIDINGIKTVNFIAAAEAGSGGTTCSDIISEKALEYIFRVNTDYTGTGDGPFNLACFKEYLGENTSGVVLYSELSSSRPDDVKVTTTGDRWNRKQVASVGTLSFNVGECYQVTLVNGCLVFTNAGTSCNKNNYNIDTPCQ